MTGVDLDANPSDTNNGMGIIPRAVSTIFSQARKLKDERGGSWNYSIKGSFIEVYNEDLIDLLSPDEATGGRREVQIREGKDGSIIWGGLREVNVRNSNEVMKYVRRCPRTPSLIRSQPYSTGNLYQTDERDRHECPILPFTCHIFLDSHPEEVYGFWSSSSVIVPLASKWPFAFATCSSRISLYQFAHIRESFFSYHGAANYP